MSEPVTPLAEAQLELFTEQTRKAVEKAESRAIRRALVGYAILFAGVLGMYINGQSTSTHEREAIVESGQAISVAGCNRDHRTTKALRNVLTTANQQRREAFRRGAITSEEYAAARKYFRQQRATLIIPDCREAQDIVTDDPDKKIVVPTPLHRKGN
jgi:hypothetical protein